MQKVKESQTTKRDQWFGENPRLGREAQWIAGNRPWHSKIETKLYGVAIVCFDKLIKQLTGENNNQWQATRTSDRIS